MPTDLRTDAEHLASLFERLAARTIPNEFGCHLWQGAVTGKRYPALRYKGQLWAIHRLLMVIEHGAIPDGHEVDHACFNERCVNPEHLRILSLPENRSLKDPRKRGHKGGRSGEWGVYLTAAGNWQVNLKKEGRYNLGGTYPTIEEASAARDELAKKLWPDGLVTPVQASYERSDAA